MKIFIESLFVIVIFTLIGKSFSVRNGSKSPNILLFLTDDQDFELGGTEPIKKTRSWLEDNGATFINSFVSIPICCPSRSSLLTGLYQPHTTVWNNSLEGNCWGDDWRSTSEKETFGALLKNAGYKTFYAGKYLNQYGLGGNDLSVPEGWDEWAGLVGNSKYYNYKLSVNGKLEEHHNNYENDYFTDVIKRKALSYLDNYKQNTLKNVDGDEAPFLMVVSNSAPHGPFTPAPQYKNNFSEYFAPRTDAFNYVKDVETEKHWILRVAPTPLTDDIVALVDDVARDRWRTLLSVDDQVDEIMRKLEELELLDNTYILYTSDHGYHLGTFALPWDKRMNYETDLRIPLYIRGPGITQKQKIEDIAINIDLAATIMDMAGETLENTDGKSLLPFIQGNNKPGLNGFNEDNDRDKFLVTYFGVGMSPGKDQDKECQAKCDNQMSHCNIDWGCKGEDSVNNTFACLRTLNREENTVCCRFEDDEGFVEAYNITDDPYQIDNLAVSNDGEKEPSWIESCIYELEKMIENL